MLLEREPELRALGDLVENLDETGGKVVLIRGEAGIGKSSLVSEFARLRRQHAHVLLHAWVWDDNPEGMHADYHPNVSACPTV